MEDIVYQIIEASIYAPSGDNSQPWKFCLTKEGALEIYNIPDRDIPLYNFNQYGSMIAHGALLENISIASKNFGYNTEIQLFPNNNPQCTARIIFKKSDQYKKKSLFAYIKKRTTNRRPYRKIPLSTEEKNILLSSLKNDQGVSLSILEDQNSLKTISEASTINEKIVLETQGLHNIFFNHVVWNQKEELEKRTGLYIKTLELAPPQEIIFRLYKNWSLAKILNSIGFSKIIAKDNAKLYTKSSAFAVIGVQNKNKDSYINSGRVMQRLWLNATKLGLSAHPITGVLFLINSVEGGEASILSTTQQKKIRDAYQLINQSCQTDKNHVTILLRLGRAEEPSARSSRLKFSIQEI